MTRVVRDVEPGNRSPKLPRIQALDERISQWRLQLPESFSLTPQTVSFVPPTILPRLLLIHIVYHQCLCALHASLVPMFSWSAYSTDYAKARQFSAQTAWEHANCVSSLLAAVLNLSSATATSWDPRRIPSFVGYAAYCASAIQMPFMWCLNPSVKDLARQNVVTNLRTMQCLGEHWKLVALLV